MAYGEEVVPLFGLSTHAGTSVDVLLLHTVQSALHRCRLIRLLEVKFKNKIKLAIPRVLLQVLRAFKSSTSLIAVFLGGTILCLV